MIAIEIIVIPLIMLFLGSLLGYWLGLRSQRIQAKKKYVADTVRDKYPALSSEINQNIGIFDDYLEDPLEHFDFPLLDQFYDDGFSKFMNDHHSDLFVSIDYLKQEITPKLHELDTLVVKSIKKIYDDWNSELYRILPREVNEESINIAHDLIRSITHNYVLKDLLNDRKDVIRGKVEACIMEKTAHIYREKTKMRRIVIRGLKTEYVDYEKVFNSLLKTAKPEISRILGLYTELQKQINKKMKLELLPLLHKYISNPYQ
jgi:hypothetical protein